MKTALLVVAILLVAMPGFSQTADQTPPHGSPSGPGSLGSNPPPPPRPNGAAAHSFTPRFYNSFDSDLSVAAPAPSPTVSRSASGITVYGNAGPWEPHVPQVYADWTLMMFAKTGTPQVGAGNGTPSLGAIAREVREAKAGAEKPKVKIKQDAEGHAVVVQRE